MKNKPLYIAYGSKDGVSLSASKVVGTSVIKDFELEFRGVATSFLKKTQTFRF